MAVFAYLRVSTDNKGQTTDNQKKLITDAGFTVDYWHAENGVSGSVKALERSEFSRMMECIESGDTLIITMIDRLGRSASDILNMVEMFKEKGIKLRVMQFDGIDITSSVGKMILTCMAAMAELERNILIERTKAGLERTKAQGTKLGAPLTIPPKDMEAMALRKAYGRSLDKLAEEFGYPRNTIHRNLKQWGNKLPEYRVEWEAREQQYKEAA